MYFLGYFFKFFLLAGIFVTVINAQPPSAGWRIIFEDNFEGNELDLDKWSYNYSWGHTHNHRAYMTPENVKVENGRLILTAERRRHPNAPHGTDRWWDQFGYIPFDYTSGAVNTQGKFDFQHGYIEGSFKMPSSEGTWPAFWMQNRTGEWPPELDILEVPHDRRQHHYYFHHGDGWQNASSFGGTHWGPDKSAGFHTYGVEWGENFMHFYFNGERIGTYWNRNEVRQANNMYMMINLAVGGWAHGPEDSDVFPTTYECEFVRVWQIDTESILVFENGDFETGVLRPWTNWNDASVLPLAARSGDFGVRLRENPASIEQVVRLQPNTTYTFSGFGRLSDNSQNAMVGVKNYGGSQVVSVFNSTDWQERSVTFTTGSENTTAVVFFYKDGGSGTAYGDDFRLEVPTTSIESQSEPLALRELINSPNPFINRTTITYSVAKESDVKLAIYSANGIQVDLLVNSTQKPGVYSADWDGSDFKEGVYFYILETNGKKEKRAMTLIR